MPPCSLDSFLAMLKAHLSCSINKFSRGRSLARRTEDQKTSNRRYQHFIIFTINMQLCGAAARRGKGIAKELLTEEPVSGHI